MRALMEADVLFRSDYDPRHPDHAPNPGIAMLVKHGFDVEVLDESIEQCSADSYDWGRYIFVMARITREIDEAAPDPQSDFLDWVDSIVEPFGGDVGEAGFADLRLRPRAAADYQ